MPRTLPPPQEITMPDDSVMTLEAEATLLPEEQDEAISILRELADRRDREEAAA